MTTDIEARPALTILSEEEEMFRDAVASFAEEEVRPRVLQMEQTAKLDPELFQVTYRRRGQVRRKGRKDTAPRLDQDHPAALRSDVAEILRNRPSGELGDGARHFHSGRAGADNHEGQQRLSAL